MVPASYLAFVKELDAGLYTPPLAPIKCRGRETLGVGLPGAGRAQKHGHRRLHGMSLADVSSVFPIRLRIRFFDSFGYHASSMSTVFRTEACFGSGLWAKPALLT